MQCLKILFSLIFLNAVQAARILSIFHTPSKSHQLLAQRLMLALVKSGHEVTIISPFPVKNAPVGLRHIHLEGVETYYDCKYRKNQIFFQRSTLLFQTILTNSTQSIELTQSTIWLFQRRLR